eukprot:scaffold990_cov393-Prasinococcus_capsulatus_cf.AAC.42
MLAAAHRIGSARPQADTFYHTGIGKRETVCREILSALRPTARLSPSAVVAARASIDGAAAADGARSPAPSRERASPAAGASTDAWMTWSRSAAAAAG